MRVLEFSIVSDNFGDGRYDTWGSCSISGLLSLGMGMAWWGWTWVRGQPKLKLIGLVLCLVKPGGVVFATSSWWGSELNVIRGGGEEDLCRDISGCDPWKLNLGSVVDRGLWMEPVSLMSSKVIEECAEWPSVLCDRVDPNELYCLCGLTGGVGAFEVSFGGKFTK